MRTAPRRRRKPLRLRRFDYRSAGAYFITVCSFRKECIFGRIAGGESITSEIGEIVDREWRRSGELRDEVALDEYVVMPNHFHGLVWLGGHGDSSPMRDRFVDGPTPGRLVPRSLGALVNGFKTAVTTRVNRKHGTPGRPIWQQRYHDHVVRSEKELERIRRYIAENPMKWHEDPENPDR